MLTEPSSQPQANVRVLLAIAAATVALMLLVLVPQLFGRQLQTLYLRMAGIDKVLHSLCSLVIVLATYWLTGRARLRSQVRTGVAVVAALLVAVLDEAVQAIVPSRTVEAFDLLASASGAALGWVVVARPRRAVGSAAVAAALCTTGYVTWSTHVYHFDYARALQYERQHDFVRAREHYLRAIAAGWRTASVYNGLAWVTVESGLDPSDAVKYAKLALDMQPGNPEILDTYGWALHRAGRSRAALPHLKDAYERRPGIYSIHYHLGQAYLAVGDTEQAASHFRHQMTKTNTREAALAAEALTRMTGGPGTVPLEGGLR